MFDAMIDSIREDTVRMTVFLAQVRTPMRNPSVSR